MSLTNRQRALKSKWAKHPTDVDATAPNAPRPTLEQIDAFGAYGRDLYAMREIRNERFRRGIAWDEPG